MARVAEELAGMFVGVFSAETVGRYVVESYELLAREARIRVYLPNLTRIVCPRAAAGRSPRCKGAS